MREVIGIRYEVRWIGHRSSIADLLACLSVLQRMLDCSSCPGLPVISARQVRVVFLGNRRYSGIALDPHLAPLVYRWREVIQCLH
jgi:hypothetical protein